MLYIYGNIDHQYTPVMLASIYHTYGSYGVRTISMIPGGISKLQLSTGVLKTELLLSVVRHPSDLDPTADAISPSLSLSLSPSRQVNDSQWHLDIHSKSSPLHRLDHWFPH